MKIKVGGRYVARNGEIVSIVNKIEGFSFYPFESDFGRGYTKDGFYHRNSCPSKYDLIQEFKDEGARSKLSTILTGLFWLAVIIGIIGFWGMAAVKLWQMIPGN